MAQPVVHFEIIGADPERLRGYYAELFGLVVGHFTDPEGNLVGLAAAS